MGNATDDVKRQAAHVTASNEDEGFAKAIDMILTGNRNRS
jgi:hydroxymethylpyrimidine pyrophosphatase-like HAD family hydrolase